MQMKSKLNKAGVSLIAVLLFMLVATIAATATWKWITSEGKSSASRMLKREAYQSAVAGIENARAWMTYHGNDLGALIKQYFDEANFVVGQNQSMELDINSIEGDWANIGDTEYFVYTKAEIMGLCIIGDHEPCFSVSSFFSKNDDTYKSQYEKFSSLLADLKAKVEEAENQPEGGEHTMENNVTPEVNEPTPVQEPIEEPANQEPEAPAAEPVAEEPVAEPEQEPVAEEEPAAEPEAEEPAEEPEDEPGLVPEEPLVDFEAQIAELQNQLNEMTTNYENAQTRIAELEAQITSASETEASLRSEIATYEAERARLEVEQREALVDRYADVLSEEEQTRNLLC